MGRMRGALVALWLAYGVLLGVLYALFPPNPDQQLFDYIGWVASTGGRLYVDVVEQNWPGAMWLHTLAIELFGPTLWASRALDYLETRPEVDKTRIAFYGLSYGGETAMRVPPLLDGYCLSICSADFNDWARRVADAHSPYGYPFHDEWVMPYFNMGNTFNYAELAYLMVPRPFMVERGHHDGVAPDEWVAAEYAKVRWVYDNLGLSDRTAIEFFNGGHTINGEGTFDFLHRHLDWPRPPGERRGDAAVEGRGAPDVP